MAESDKLTHYTFDAGGVTYDLWSLPNALDPYVSGLTPVAEDNTGADIAVTISGYSRQQYPNDPTPINVGGHQRTRLVKKRAKRSTLPGSNAYIEQDRVEGAQTVTDVIQFTHNAPFVSLHAFIFGAATQDFILRSAEGTPYAITTASP